MQGSAASSQSLQNPGLPMENSKRTQLINFHLTSQRVAFSSWLCWGWSWEGLWFALGPRYSKRRKSICLQSLQPGPPTCPAPPQPTAFIFPSHVPREGYLLMKVSPLEEWMQREDCRVEMVLWFAFLPLQDKRVLYERLGEDADSSLVTPWLF